MTIGGKVLQSNQSDEVFVGEFDAQGVGQGLLSFGGPGDQRAFGIAADSLGRITFVGESTGNIEVTSETLPNGGSSDVFVGRLTPP